MTRRWEQRVRAALFTQRGVPLASRVSAGFLLARVHGRRLRFRTAVVATTAFVLAVLSFPVVVAALLLAQIL